MASKLNFRARTLDASKPMSIYHVEDLPELADLNAINRSVPAMPSGMEKEEEAEKHLQDILESQEASYTKKPDKDDLLVIPTPEVYVASDFDDIYRDMYKGSYKPPRQYIHVQPFTVDQDSPDYDMDQEDEVFLRDVLNGQKKFEVSSVTLEDMLDRLEKNSSHNIVSAKEAKLLLKEDDELILTVYDYWVEKRLRLKRPLIPMVRTDKRDGGLLAAAGSNSGASSAASSSAASSSANSNPYIAFRRRTEKMQTRKNRKNDEVSYEKMLKLQRDLHRAVTLLEMVKRREKTKKEHLNLTADIFEKRFQASDWDGKVIAEIAARQMSSVLQQQHHHHQRVLQPAAYNNAKYAENWINQVRHQQAQAAQPAGGDAPSGSRQKRAYVKKKRHKNATAANKASNASVVSNSRNNGPEFGTAGQSSEDERSAFNLPSQSDAEEDELEGPFAFRRKRNCQYLAPLQDELGFEQVRGWPWDSPAEGGGGEAKYKYSLTSLSTPVSKCIGMVRRRVGRGGRIVLDRAFADHDDFFRSMDFTVINGCGRGTTPRTENRDPFMDHSGLHAEFADWAHYRPVTPPTCQEEDYDPYKTKLQETVMSGLPTHPIKPQPPNSSSQPSSHHSRGGGGGGLQHVRTSSTSATAAFNGSGGGSLRSVPVDSVVAHNAVSALVTSTELDIFGAHK